MAGTRQRSKGSTGTGPPAQRAAPNGQPPDGKATAADIERAVDEVGDVAVEKEPKGDAKPKKARAKPKTAKFRGLTLNLPDKLPPTIMFDAIEMEADPQNGMTVLRLLRSVLGTEQFIQVRYKLTDNDELDDLSALISDVMEQYGFSVGKLPASDAS